MNARQCVVLLALLLPTAGNALGEWPTTNDAERYVFEQIGRGGTATFSNGEPNVIRGAFVAALINLAGSNAPNGICVIGAEIEGPVISPNSTCATEIRFERCRFKGAVNLRHTDFTTSASMIDSLFENEVDLRDITVAGHLDISGSSFRRGISLSFADIKGNLFSSGAFFEGAAQLNQMKIGLGADFESPCIDIQALTKSCLTTNDALAYVRWARTNSTNHSVTCVVSLRFATNGFGAPVSDHLDANEWLLIDDDRSQMFSISVSEKEIRILRKTYFSDGADFNNSQIGSLLRASAVCFSGPVRANSLKVGSGVYMEAAQFEKGATFGYSEIGNEFSLAWSLFAGAADANFYGMKAGRVMLSNARFNGPVNFEQSVIATAVEAQRTIFSHTNSSASFSGVSMKELDLSEAEFAGAADFGGASMSQLIAQSAWFRNRRKPAKFYGVKVEGTASFADVVFDGPVNFLLADIAGNLDMENTRFDNALGPKVLNEVTDGVSTYNTDFGSMRVGGFAMFTRAQMAGRISFRNVRVGNLHLDWVDLIYPWRHTNELRLEGLTYEGFRAITNVISTQSTPEMRESWGALRKVLYKHTPYSFEVYNKLENYFRREGETRIADEVFIAGKRRERTETMKFLSLTRFCSWVLDVTVGYGKRPARAFLISLVPLFVGWLMFPINQMKSLSANPCPYHPLWFSLAVLLPVISLWIDEHWAPKAGDKIRWGYLVVHKFAGWVLIPIGLAAFSGIIK